MHNKIGFNYILLHVLKHSKLISKVFKTRKFQENFLSQIREAVRDIATAYGIAAVLVFKESSSFPTNRDLIKCQ